MSSLHIDRSLYDHYYPPYYSREASTTGNAALDRLLRSAESKGREFNRQNPQLNTSGRSQADIMEGARKTVAARNEETRRKQAAIIADINQRRAAGSTGTPIRTLGGEVVNTLSPAKGLSVSGVPLNQTRNVAGASAVAKAALSLGKRTPSFKTTSNIGFITQLAVGHVSADMMHVSRLVKAGAFAKAGASVSLLRDKYTTDHASGVDVAIDYGKRLMRGATAGDIPSSINLDNFVSDVDRANSGYGGYHQALTDIDAPTIRRVALPSTNLGQNIGNQVKGLGDMMVNPKDFANALCGGNQECANKVAGGTELDRPKTFQQESGVGGTLPSQKQYELQSQLARALVSYAQKRTRQFNRYYS